MNFDYFIVELKKLNPKCNIKLTDNHIYLSKDPSSLILPENVAVVFDRGSYYFSGGSLSRVQVSPLHLFPLNERDYFPEVVFRFANYENIYELTHLDTKTQILKYLQKISEITPTVALNTYFAMGTTKYLAYEGLKQEPKFKRMPINETYQKELYAYVNSIAKPEIYKEPQAIQEGWESFQSWHITGGSAPDSTTLTHRFYLSISPDKVYLVAKKLLEKYRELKEPFYFKIAEGRAVKDSIVIYTSHKTLDSTLKILRDLEPFMRSIQNDLGSAHPLTYPLTPWLGYASEIMDGRTSYTDLISSIISIPLVEEVNRFAKVHKNDDNIHGMSGTEFFGDTDIDEKIKRGQLVIRDIMQDKEAIDRLLNNILSQMQKEDINLENIFFDNHVVSDLMNYRERVYNKSFHRGAISISLILVATTILLGIVFAFMIR